MSKCRACRTVSEASDYYPPSLPVSSRAGHLPPVAHLVLGSSWSSDRCETRPYGMFLTRRLTFGNSVAAGHGVSRIGGKYVLQHKAAAAGAQAVSVGRNWWEERMQYFTDPGCRTPYFSVYGRGRYTIGNAVSAFGHDVAYEADFEVTQIKVTINDRRLLPVVENCGFAGPVRGPSSFEGDDRYKERNDGSSTTPSEKWSVGVERDVTASGGCSALNVRMPTSPIPQLIAAVRRGGPHDVVLLVGQRPMDSLDDFGDDGPSKQQRRPTSFYPGLRRCIDGSRTESATITESLRREGTSSVSTGGGRRPWRHVVMSSSSARTGVWLAAYNYFYYPVAIYSCSVVILMYVTKRQN